MAASGTTLQLIYWIELERLGRRRLAEAAALSEMAVRLELERLRDRGLLELRRTGPRLTAKGTRRFGELFRSVLAVRPLELTTLRVGSTCLGAHVRSIAVPPAWEARDVAVRAGASGLVLLRHASGGWLFTHNAEPAAERNKADASLLGSLFGEAIEEDHLLLACAESVSEASRGLWAVLAEMLSIAP